MPRAKRRIEFTPGVTLKPQTKKLDILFSYEEITRRLLTPIQIPNVNKIVRDMRIRRRVSQGTLCKAIKAGRGHLSEIELGYRQPTIIKLAQIAHALGYKMTITFTPTE